MQHLALIMDGNRRWAKKRALQPWLGHQEGIEAIKRVLEFCLSHNISYLSLYAFSLENFNRSEQEKSYLFNVLAQQIEKKFLSLLLEQKIQVRFLGDRALFPESTKQIIERVEEKTKQNKRLVLNLLFCYGGRQEIVGGVKTLLKKVTSGEISIDEISDETLSQCLWTHDIPEPDMIIRTGGAKRLSNFLLYQAAYSELYFLDCLWPEIDHTHLQKAFESFSQIQRNFGV